MLPIHIIVEDEKEKLDEMSGGILSSYKESSNEISELSSRK
jgi:hypothetical protein